MASHQKTFRASSGSFAIQGAVRKASPTIEATLEQQVANGQTDFIISLFVESAGLKSFHIWADQALTVKTNSIGSPQETFALNGIDAISWMDGEGAAPIAGDVTKLYVTNASGSSATLKLLAGWVTLVALATATPRHSGATCTAAATVV